MVPFFFWLIISVTVTVTSIAFGRLAVSLLLKGKRLRKSQAGMDLFVDSTSDPSGICKSNNARRSLLPTSTLTKHPPREPTSIAFTISLQAKLWRSVIISEMVYYCQPDGMCTLLQMFIETLQEVCSLSTIMHHRVWAALSESFSCT